MNNPEPVEFLFKKPQVEESAEVNQVALDAFGALLMRWVRDYAISEIDDLVSGKSMGLTAARYPDLPELFNDEQFDVIHRLIPDIVDMTLGHLIWKLDEVEWVDVAVHTEVGTVPSLRETTLNGLEMDFLEWVPRFQQATVFQGNLR